MEYIDLVNIEKIVMSALKFGILKYLPRGVLLSKTSFLSGCTSRTIRVQHYSGSTFYRLVLDGDPCPARNPF